MKMNLASFIPERANSRPTADSGVQLPSRSGSRRAAVGLLLAAGAILITPLRAQEPAAVTLTEDAATYTLDNGIVAARVAKASGDLVSLRFRNREMLATILDANGQPDLEKDPPGANPNGLNRGMTDHQYAFWSHDAMGPKGTAPAVAGVTIDPKSNAGSRAEVSVKGLSKDRKMGTGPGSTAQGQFAADVEIRYALGRGDAGVYTYCVFEHQPDYPASAIGEARFCAKLNAFFDWMSVSPSRNKHYPATLVEGDKYVYTVNQWENRAFGWSSTTEHVGFWIINPSMEYMSGGPTKIEFQGHRDTNKVAAPCVLNYWRSSHYGGAAVDVAAGEHWTKVIGPFFIYANAGDTPQAMYDDARAQQKKQTAAWPLDWVKGVDYPAGAQRANVQGRLVLDDPRSTVQSGKFSRLRVGLTAADWQTNPAGPSGATRTINWQQDAKNYQFWVDAGEDGRFTIPYVRPGAYVLRAMADGVLGEFAKAEVVVAPGKPLNLGDLTWTPVRRGRQLWDVGIPNRTATEFFRAESYWEPEISLDYAKLFPKDITYIPGKSDFRRDWFFQHVPHNEDPAAKAAPFFGIRGNGRATPYAIRFDMAGAPKGKATLRLALCGTGIRELEVLVNEQPAGKVQLGMGDGVITRHGIQGLWYERELGFDASLLKQGANVLTLVVPAGPINNGVIYDYIRLELAD